MGVFTVYSLKMHPEISYWDIHPTSTLHCTVAKKQARCKLYGEKTRKAEYGPSHIIVTVEKLIFLSKEMLFQVVQT